VTFLVIGDRALADELTRALSPLGEDVVFAVSFFEEALPQPLSAVVLSESTTVEKAEVVASIVGRAQGGLAPVWLAYAQGAGEPRAGSYTAVPRAGLVPAARTLLGASEKHRVPVQILARWRSRGEDETSRRLANVVGLSEKSLVVEIDEELAPGAEVDVSFIMPGTAHRIQVGGIARDYIDERRALRKIELDRVGDDDRDILRAFLQRRLSR
jgi:hypothetical protein